MPNQSTTNIHRFDELSESVQAELLDLTAPWYELNPQTHPRYCARALIENGPYDGELVYAALARGADGTLIGWCAFVLRDGCHEIVNTYTHESLRRQGLSGRMIEAIRSYVDGPIIFKSYRGRGVSFAKQHGLKVARYGVAR